MSRDKQIEEMKSIIEKAEEEYSEIWKEWFYDHKEGMKIDREFLFFAKILYDAGYRKSEEVAEEIFEEIEKYISPYRYPIIAELKKKYTEEGK